MTRDEFMNMVYSELHSDGDNYRANRIIDAADEYVETEKALDQEDVLGKIRAEILQVANQEKVHDEKWALGLRYAIKIIDKYKVESEEKERRCLDCNHCGKLSFDCGRCDDDCSMYEPQERDGEKE